MATLSLASASLRLEIDPETAGRVTSLTYQGKELLSGPDLNPANWGATFWTSPQSDWGWPPVETIDSSAYEVVEHSSARIILRSALVELGERRFHIEKRVSVGPEGSIDLAYVIDNVGSVEFSMASWEISRVFSGGLTFFPTGDAELTPVPPHGELAPQKSESFSWFDHSTFKLGHSIKLHADGKQGLLAHLADGLLMLKCFDDSPPELQAPGEGEVEIFANEDGKYVEVEVQGPWLPIAPGSRQVFAVRTHVVPCDLGSSERAELARLALKVRQAVGVPASEA